MRRIVVLAVMGVALLGVGGVGCWYYYTGTPQHSLSQLGKAVKGKDYETARYFVDDERMSDTISKSVVDTLIAQVTKKMEETHLSRSLMVKHPTRSSMKTIGMPFDSSIPPFSRSMIPV